MSILLFQKTLAMKSNLPNELRLDELRPGDSSNEIPYLIKDKRRQDLLLNLSITELFFDSIFDLLIFLFRIGYFRIGYIIGLNKKRKNQILLLEVLTPEGRRIE